MTEYQALVFGGALGLVIFYLWRLHEEARTTNAYLKHIIDLLVDGRFTYSDDLHLARLELTRIADKLASDRSGTKR